jgi:hypothetical protein
MRFHRSSLMVFVVLSLTVVACLPADAGPLNRATAVPFSALPREPRVQIVDLGGRVQAVLSTGANASLGIRRGRHTLARMDIRRLRPWKLTVGDADSDGRPEIAVGVYKPTRFWPYPHPCLFLYRWDGNQIIPVWRGSNLSKPFVDFAFVRTAAGSTKLCSVEVLADGRRCLNVYHWNGFGFTGDRQEGSWRTASLVSTLTGRIRLNADGVVHSFQVR